MQLLSLHYTNIGPFQGQTILVRPDFGSYLIKAPIGSGKSFLFFDGPLFALYKKATRLMLNTNSNQGEVVCEFLIDGVQYCIQRTIKKTKTGESISSKLRIKEVSNDEGLSTDGGIVEYLPLSPFELPNGYAISDFKNETDLQKNLDAILPPKEVFLGTHFLMQDSNNIFELPPKERLEIFKHVFGLLGIDESKDKIAEQKREIGAIIKSRADMTQYDMKLKSLLEKLVPIWQSLEQAWNRHNLEQASLSHWTSFVSDQILLHDKVMIEHLTLPDMIDLSILQSSLQHHQQRHTELQTQLRHDQAQIVTLTSQITELNRLLETKRSQSDHIDVQLQRHSDEEFQVMTQQLQSKQEEKQMFVDNLDLTKVWDMMYQLSTKLQSSDVQSSINNHQEDTTIVGLRSVIQSCIDFGKDAKSQLTLWEEKKNNMDKRITDLQSQIQASQSQVTQFKQSISEKTQYHCDKIQGSCPYVEMINGSMVKTLRIQGDAMKGDLETKQTQHTTLLDEQSLLIDDPLMKTLLADANIVKEILISTQRKLREEEYKQIQQFDKEISVLQTQRSALQTQQSQIVNLKEQRITLQSEQQSLVSQVQEYNHILTTLQSQIYDIQAQQLQLIPSDQLNRDSMIITEYTQLVDRLGLLLSEFKENQLLIKQLKEKEKILSDLYLVFSKELLLIVVQSNLPQIQDLMNMYLSQVVDYQLIMDIDKKSTSTESLELFVTVRDHLGERKVESLSGGQKVILKLVWMMAISVITRSQMLFLDETINNLDGDTVAKVAELLTNFTKGKGDQFQFYVVTHSHQIQDMGIWDSVIIIKGSSGENIASD